MKTVILAEMADQFGVVGPGPTALIGIYFVALGITLIFFVALVWPPDFEVATQRVGGNKDQKDVDCPIVFPHFLAPSATPTTKEDASPAATAIPPSQTSASPVPNNSGSHSPIPADASANAFRIPITYDRRLLVLVIAIGALGSYIHVVSSFGDFVGNRTLRSSWIWWYLLRPFVGVPLAAIFYFVIRAGFLTAGASAGDVNRFGIAAVAGLVGMFSVTAADKLKELFSTLFKTEVERKDALDSAKPGSSADGEDPAPTISSVDGEPTVIRIHGAGFTTASRITINGTERPSDDITFISAEELTVARKSQNGQVTISITNSASGGGSTGEKTVTLPNA